MAGFVYILCFSAPLSGKRARHYIGWASKHPTKRIEAHASGTAGAVFTTEAHRQGITFQVGNIWPDKTKDDERRLKRQRNHRRYCGICRLDAVARVMPQPKRKPANGVYTPVNDDDIEDYPF